MRLNRNLIQISTTQHCPCKSNAQNKTLVQKLTFGTNLKKDNRTMPKTVMKLIITADDFGYCPERNRAVRGEFLKHGASVCMKSVPCI